MYLVNLATNNTGMMHIPPTDRHLAGYEIRKIDKNGHDVWDHLYALSTYKPYILIENLDTSITVWSYDCNPFTIDSNGTFLRKDFWNNRSCSAPARMNPYKMTESSQMILEYMNQTQGKSNHLHPLIVDPPIPPLPL